MKEVVSPGPAARSSTNPTLSIHTTLVFAQISCPLTFPGSQACKNRSLASADLEGEVDGDNPRSWLPARWRR